MSWISDNHRCGLCGAVYNMIVKKDKREEDSQCPDCLREGREGRGKRTVSTPNINTVTYPDGRKRPEIQRYKDEVRVKRELKKESDRKVAT